MEEKFAKLISIIFQPLMMPLLTLMILFNSNTYIAFSVSNDAKTAIYFLFTTFTVVLPTLVFLFLIRRGIISSLEMREASERRIPFLVSIILYFALYYILRKLQLPGIVYLLLLSTILSIVICFFITLIWKISIHMIAVGGVIGSLLGLSIRLGADFILPIYLVVLLAGFIGFARLKLHAHSPAQVYSGFLVGTALMAGIIFFV